MIALWKGWLPSVIGVIPYVGLNFAVYETLKDSVLKYYGELTREQQSLTCTETSLSRVHLPWHVLQSG